MWPSRALRVSSTTLTRLITSKVSYNNTTNAFISFRCNSNLSGSKEALAALAATHDGTNPAAATSNPLTSPAELAQSSGSAHSRNSDGLLRSLEQNTTKRVLCVDYVPDGVGVDEIRHTFEPYVRVSRVQLDSTRTGRFFGRAYVVVPTDEEAQRVMNTPPECGGAVLHVAPWVPPTGNTNSVLFIRNLPPDKDTVSKLFKLFSESGVVSHVSEGCKPEQAVGHVEFNDADSAQHAYLRSVKEGINIDGNELDVSFSVNPPKRILQISRFRGDEEQLRGLLGVNLPHVLHTQVRVDNQSVALVEFDTVEAASRAKFFLRERNVDVKFSKLKRLVRQNFTALANSTRRYLLHVSDIPLSLSRLQLIGKILAVKSELPAVTWIFDRDGQFSGRAFVRYDCPEEAALTLSHHNSSKPFVIGGHQVKLTTSNTMVDMRRPSRWILVDGALNGYRKQLALLMGEYGTVLKVRRGSYRTGRYVVEFADISGAVRAMEAHYLEPFTVDNRQWSLEFIVERTERKSGTSVGSKENVGAASAS